MAVILDIGTIPQTFTSGNWPLSHLNTGKWQVTVTPTNASTSTHHGDYRAILADNAGNGGLWFATPTDAIGLFKASDGSAIFERVCTWAAGATITITVDMAIGSATIAGCLTGNGTFSFTPATVFQAGTLGAGTYPPNSGFNLAGTMGDVDDTVVTRSASVSYTQASDTVALTGTVANTVRSASVSYTQTADTVTLTGTNGTSDVTASVSYTQTADSVTSATAVRVGASVSTTQVADTVSVTGSVVTPPVDGLPTLGDHDKTIQTFGSGSNPCTTTLQNTQSGSIIALSRGGKISDQAVTPTANAGATFTLSDIAREYTDWSGYGTSFWVALNITGQATHSFSSFVTSFDEHSQLVTEIRGVSRVAAHQWTQQGNTGAAGTIVAPSVTVNGPAFIIIEWWGAGPVGGGNHVVSCNNGFVELDSYGIDDPNGYVQVYRFYKIVSVAGTYGATLTHSPTQGAQVRTVAFTANFAGITVAQSADTVASTASVSAGAAVNFTQSADTVTSSASPSVAASVSATQSADTVTSSVGVRVGASTSFTQSADTVAATGVVIDGVSASVSYTQQADTVTSSATHPVNASIGVSQSPDSVALTGRVDVRALIAFTQIADLVAVAVGQSANASVSYTQASDTVAAQVQVAIAAQIVLTQSPDVVHVFVGDLPPIDGQITYTQQSDSVSMTVGHPMLGLRVIVSRTHYVDVTDDRYRAITERAPRATRTTVPPPGVVSGLRDLVVSSDMATAEVVDTELRLDFSDTIGSATVVASEVKQ